MPLHNPPDDRQAHTGTFEFIASMQPLKNTEEFVGVAHVEARAIVFDEVDDLACHPRASDLDVADRAVTRELDRVAEQVYEELLEHRSVCLTWQQVAEDVSAE